MSKYNCKINPKEDYEYQTIDLNWASGAAWYGNNLPVTGVQKIFDAMVNACIAKRGRPLSNDDILKIPDIDMFKDIYMQ